MGGEWQCLCVYYGRRMESEHMERQQDPGVTADKGRNGCPVHVIRQVPSRVGAPGPSNPESQAVLLNEEPEAQAGGVTCPGPNTQLCSLRPSASAPGPGRVSASV